MPFGRISVGNHQCQKMIYVSNVIFNQHYFSIQAITAALNGIPHVYVELLPLAQVQRMGSGSDSIWGQKKMLEPVCYMSNIFSVFHSSSTDSTCRQKKRLEPLLHVKYFQFSTVAVQIQLAGKKLLEPVCCMSNIFSVFHSSSTDSTCRQKKRLEPVCCMSNIFSFPQ